MPARELTRVKSKVRGSVQGVGFRPHVFRLATGMGLRGWIRNTPEGVEIETEGLNEVVSNFLNRLTSDLPPLASIRSLDHVELEPVGHDAFEILVSADGERRAEILPDAATCPDCLADLKSDPRRLAYPFTNCTNCGPRFSILRSLPYDRDRTTMADFLMCPDCSAEYDDPADRRFHAQPNACHKCGPHVDLWQDGRATASKDEAISLSAKLISDGKIVAVKGLGGFHLCTTAMDAAAIDRLRFRKAREEKPLAVMVGSPDQARTFCVISPQEERLLKSPAAPIVLVGMKPGQQVLTEDSVAPGMREFGIVLPYTPLHHLLMERIQTPIIATSGNVSDEPICTENQEAARRLEGIADAFLIHNRPIERSVEDSVTRVVMGREIPIRRSRGYAPHPVTIPDRYPGPTALAVGAHQKCTVALGIGSDAFVSQHLGDLSTAAACSAFSAAVRDLPRLYSVTPEVVVRDLHPDYASSRWADSTGLPVASVQHHVAHALGCLAENRVPGPALAVVWDGTGLGVDGTIWGGEFFFVSDGEVARVAHLRPFQLPGGDKAAREPRRPAAGVMHELRNAPRVEGQVLGFSPQEWSVMRHLLDGTVESPVTTSAGRLFDAVSCLIGLRTRASFEGQAAMELEHLASSGLDATSYPFDIKDGSPIVVDWRPAVSALLNEIGKGIAQADIARRFHVTLATIAAEIARRIDPALPVALTGGCFQNRLLTELTSELLQAHGSRAILHSQLPPNDGGLSYGQLIASRSRAARDGGFVVDYH